MDENSQVEYQEGLPYSQPQKEGYREVVLSAMMLCPHAQETLKYMFPHLEGREQMNILRVIIQHALTYTQSDVVWTGQLNPALLDGKSLSADECSTLSGLMYWYADTISRTVAYVYNLPTPVMTYISDYAFMYVIGVFDQ